MCKRLKGVQIENKPAVELIRSFNHPNVFIYADPPYVFSTRSRKQYRFEMSDNGHIEMLEALVEHKGTVMISGYDNPLYNKYLIGWEKKHIEARAENSLPRTETIWMNYEKKTPIEEYLSKL